MNSGATAAIDIENLEFAWPKQPSLLSIAQLSIACGERVFLQGPSGSGKSTLLALIGGVLVPRCGAVRVLGTDLARLSPAARDRFRGENLGFVFQMFNLIPYLSVLDNVLLAVQFSPARGARLPRGEARTEALRLLTRLGLAGSETAAVTRLSIGQQQRVAVARALLGRPAIVVADEPTSALDAAARMGFIELLMSEAEALGTTLLFVSHEQSLAGRFDRTLCMTDLTHAPAVAA